MALFLPLGILPQTGWTAAVAAATTLPAMALLAPAFRRAQWDNFALPSLFWS